MTVSLKILLASFALASASAGTAYADCAAELARLENGTSASTAEGIAKDGSLAPLQDAGAAGQTAQAGTGTNDASSSGEENRIAKDGSTAPLEDAGDSVPDQAMSAQDVQAQQEGEPTAAAQADHPGTNDRAAALSQARTALEAGDEAACLEALEGMTAS